MAEVEIVRKGDVQMVFVDGFNLPDVTAIKFETDTDINPHGYLTITLWGKLKEKTTTQVGK